MKSKPLLVDENVLMIRRSGNPQRYFCKGTTMEQLGNMSYAEVLDAFEQRTYEWYLDVGELIAEHTDTDFMLTTACCVVMDLLSQYIYGRPSSSKKIFRQFFTDYLTDYDFVITPPIKTCYYHKSQWMQEDITSVAAAFYHCFRCGVVHSGRILEYGRFSREEDLAIQVRNWRHEGRLGTEIVVQPVLLLRRLRAIFAGYMEALRTSDPQLVRKFRTKFKIEYGIVIP